MIAAIVGVVFILIGVTTVIPTAGLFGVFWTLIAVGITGYHIYNLSSSKGVGIYEVDIQDGNQTNDFDTKLRKLKKLYEDGILSKEEYDSKKNEIINSKW